ncbi:MAG: TIGR01777 family oxidoreductase [Succinivibrionaceae bacterium]|nr:TIGR01777 family oxidoreductase [Ruminobacter sp.]MDY5778866.1 TIGR01777 family oxidoreductase [Succinivibrionaceae bacterium]MEE1340003.1 TIGR01777 family oxidoreductase [Succinivibrionaceae bacterium]
MRILITGATGFIAQNIIKTLSPEVELILLTRRPKVAQKIYDSLSNIEIISEINEDTPHPDVVINLAGSPLFKRSFSFQSKHELIASRVNYTKNLCKELKEYKKFPQVFISASASSIYGSKKHLISESAEGLGGSFCGNLAMDWENSVYEGCKSTPCRVVLLRFGVVVGKEGGIYKNIKTPFKLGLGAIIGNGKQYLPWISVHDAVRSIVHIIRCSKIKGAVNIATTNANTQKDFATALASSFNKKVLFKIPKSLISITKGDLASPFIDSTPMTPTKLIQTGFKFDDTDLKELLNNMANNRS